MTLPESETTPLALTASLFHEAGRLADYISCGRPKAPWDELPDSEKGRIADRVARIRNQSFSEFYDWLSKPARMAEQQVAPATDERDDLVRHARMLHGIVHGLLQQEAMDVASGDPA